MPSVHLDELDVAWAAGFFDGEGCISLYKRYYKGKANYGFALRVSVAQADEAPLKKLKKMFGGALSTRHNITKTWRGIVVWSISTNQAADALEKMLPYLVVKKKQAQVAVAYQRMKAQRTFGERTIGEKRQDEKIYNELKELKR